MIETSQDNYSLFISVYEDVLGSVDTSMRAVNKYSTEPEYTYCTYVKGVLMFDSLYQVVGKTNFINSLKFYYYSYKYKNVKPEHLISSFESVCEKDFKGFFNSWVQGKVVVR